MIKDQAIKICMFNKVIVCKLLMSHILMHQGIFTSSNHQLDFNKNPFF